MGRFKAAAIAYGCALKQRSSAKVYLCHGDALLYSGQRKQALRQYQSASENDESILYYESKLKCILCEALEIWEGDSSLPTPKKNPNYAFWSEQILSSHADLRHGDTLTSSLFLAFFYEDDDELWFTALQSALYVADPNVLIATLYSAMPRCGYALYTRFREKLLRDGVDATTVSAIDGIAHKINIGMDDRNSRNMTLRTTGSDHFDTVVEP